ILVFNKGFLFYLEFNFRLFFKLLFTPADCFGAVDLDTLLAMRKVAWLRRKVVVYDAHEIFTEVPELLHKPFKKAIWKTLERLFLPGVKYSYTVNQSLADYYHEQYGLKMVVVRNMPFYRYPTTPLPNKGFILYQGAINE